MEPAHLGREVARPDRQRLRDRRRRRGRRAHAVVHEDRNAHRVRRVEARERPGPAAQHHDYDGGGACPADGAGHQSCRLYAVLDLFPITARVDGGELTLGGVGASALAAEHGTPLLVYCEETVRAQARAYREAAPGALVVYGTKAFANVELLRVLADEGIGADVSTLGELAFARAAGLDGDRIVFHGNNKTDEELSAAADAGAIVVLDEADEVDRAAAAGVRRVLLRLTPGIEADTHRSIQTAHASSKFGLPLESAAVALDRARERGLELVGVHVHIGSQLARVDESAAAVERVVAFCEERRWRPALVD